MPGVASPPVILEGFGFGAGASYITTPIPFASQQPNPRASYTDGFPPQTVGATATDPPDVRDFNGILYAATQNIAALLAGQYHEFDSAISAQNTGYALGAIVPAADNSGFWVNLTSGNTNNPDTSAAGSGWAPLAQYGLVSITGLTNANVTLTAPQAAKEMIILSGTLTGNVQIIFPAWTERWLIANNTTGAFTVTCKTSAGSGVIMPQGVTTMIYGDGTNIDLVGSSLSANTGAVANTLAERDANAYLWAAAFKIAPSDEALKYDIAPIDVGLEVLDFLKGFTFKVKGSAKRAAGTMAQLLRRAFPDAVDVDSDGRLGVDAMATIGLLLSLLGKERDERMSLERRVSELEKR